MSDEEKAISRKPHCEVCKYTRLVPIVERSCLKCPECGLETPLSKSKTPNLGTVAASANTESKMIIQDKPNASLQTPIFQQKKSMKRDMVDVYRERRRLQSHELDDELLGQNYTITNVVDIIKPSTEITDPTTRHSTSLRVKGLTYKQEKGRLSSSGNGN